MTTIRGSMPRAPKYYELVTVTCTPFAGTVLTGAGKFLKLYVQSTSSRTKLLQTRQPVDCDIRKFKGF